MSRYPILTDFDREALQAFADNHGRKWKDELSMIYWYNARIWRYPKYENPTYGDVLHNIRNNFGPTWLYDVCDIKPVAKAKRK